MFWDNLDLDLYTCGKEGKFYLWELGEGCQPKEAK